MKTDETASISLKKIICISLIFILILGVSVLAGNIKLESVTIQFSNNHEITVLTSKTKISEILEENHIILEENETVTPGLDADITSSKKIIISIKGNEPVKLAENVVTEVNTEELVANYKNLTEEIVTVQEEIPFETITKDVSNESTATVDRIIQYGQNGIREVVYKITYKDNVEIEREELSSQIIKEPVNKIVQVQTNTVTSRSTYDRVSGTSGQTGIYKVTAYCPCAICCGKTDGVTASGTQATANHTVAAPSTFSFGTQLVINGVTYTVEDRGGAIQGNRIDVYMNSHAEALAWGVRYVEVEVLN